MSYELSGLGAAATPMGRRIVNWKHPVASGPGYMTAAMQAFVPPTINKDLTFGIPPPMSLVRPTKLLHPSRVFRTAKRRTPPHVIGMTLTRLPASAVQPSNLTGLGFSLKLPKWVRKLTIAKVIKPLAITAAVVGAALIPGALPLLGKGVGLLAKGAIGAGKLVGTKLINPLVGGVKSVFNKPAAVQGAQTQAEYDAEQAAANQAAQAAADQAAANAQAAANQAAQDAANQAAQDAANQAAQRSTGPSGTLGPSNQVPYNPPTYAPAGGGGGYSVPAATAEYGPQTEAQAAQAGTGNSLIPIGIGLVALIAVSGALKRGR